MDLIGIEPMTSSMPWKRAPSCATGPQVNFSSLHELEPAEDWQYTAKVSQMRFRLSAVRPDSGHESVEPEIPNEFGWPVNRESEEDDARISIPRNLQSNSAGCYGIRQEYAPLF